MWVEVAYAIFLVSVGQGYLVFFPPATRDQINCMSVPWAGITEADAECACECLSVPLRIHACKCEKKLNSGCGCLKKIKKSGWRVKMCIFELVCACVLSMRSVKLYERLRVLDQMRKHHFLFAG